MVFKQEPRPKALARAHLPTYQPLDVAVVSFNGLLPAVREFKELSDLLRGHIPKALAKALLPEAAVDHARSAVELDTRMRRWRSQPDSPFELLYRSSQAEVRWSNPAGPTASAPHCMQPASTKMCIDQTLLCRCLKRLL